MIQFESEIRTQSKLLYFFPIIAVVASKTNNTNSIMYKVGRKIVPKSELN